MASEEERRAIERMCNSCYHQSLWLPETSEHGKLRVTYATSRNFDDEDLPVLLFIPPMFSSRYHVAAMDHLASESGVRLLSADRPGFGGATPVDLSLRVVVWLETLPILLRKLKVEHVSLLCHSAGTVYTLNTLHDFRHILDPRAPYAAIVAPWVTTKESHAVLAGVLSSLPTGVIKGWHGLAKTFNSIMPAIQWSSGVPAEVVDLFNPSSLQSVTDTTPEAEKYGCDAVTAQYIAELSTRYLWAESTSALNDEALTCLDKAGPDAWKACKDYGNLIQTLAQRESEVEGPRLQLDAFFAASDVLIGDGGRKYIEKCFAPASIAEYIKFKSQTKPGTNHDSVMIDHNKGVIRDVFKRVAELKRGQGVYD